MKPPKTMWIKPGTRVDPQIYDWVRQFADDQSMSFNDAVNALLQEAIEQRKEVKT